MRTLKFLHRWLGVLAAFFILMFAISGIVLNHRGLFSSVDVNRKFIPGNYRYNNWNFSAIRAATLIGKDSLLVYGNIGIWLTDEAFGSFTPFMHGLPKGTDRKRSSVIQVTQQGKVVAGTMSGLYLLTKGEWKKLDMPVTNSRITGMVLHNDSLWILTRSLLLAYDQSGLLGSPRIIQLPPPVGMTRKTSLFRAIWVVHSGEILGLPGKLLVDLMGVAMILLCLTGIFWFVAPDLMKSLRRRKKIKQLMVRINRLSFRWHNKIGIWFLGFMILSVLTGMFLRPPLLIPIARKTFPAIRHTILDHSNYWHDKLRGIQYDPIEGAFLVSTSEGFYHADILFADSLRRVPWQPPVSVMGINVFEIEADSSFLVGSFSGIYRWNRSDNHINDYITGLEVKPGRGMVNPFGAVAVAGYIKQGHENIILFDYNQGAIIRAPGQFPEMPEAVKNASGMSLWNLALEVHTGRIYSFVLGRWYILFIPIAGISILTILISGLILWLKRRWKKKHCSKEESIPSV